MATDFNKDSIIMSGGLMPSVVDTPLDVRTRIETLDDIFSIPVPYVGMLVYVKDTGKRYEVLTLKDKKVGFKVTKNAMVDTYREVILSGEIPDIDLSEYAKVEDEENRDIFQTDLLTVQQFGGIAAGADLNGMTTHEILMKMLFPYIAPQVGIVCEPDGGVFEIGSKAIVANVKVDIVKKSEPITKIVVLHSNNIIATQEDELIANGGTFNYPVNTEVVASNKGLVVQVTDASGNMSSSSSKPFDFVYPYFVGVCEEDAEINEELLLGLNKKVELKGNKTVSYTTENQRMVLAYPVEYGTLARIYDANNFDVTSTFEHLVMDIVCLDGTTQKYNVYVNNASTVENFAMKFSY